MKNCPYCGTTLKQTSWENLWCPNCGKIELEDTEDSEEKERNYIG